MPKSDVLIKASRVLKFNKLSIYSYIFGPWSRYRKKLHAHADNQIAAMPRIPPAHDYP